MPFELTIKSAEDIAAEESARLIEAAKSRVRASASRAAAQFMAGVPDHEVAAWSTKAVAATAHLAGTATDRQTAMLSAEAGRRGVTAADLAALIDAKATAMMEASAHLTGLRAAADAAIDADPANASDAAAAFEAAVAEHSKQ